MTVPANAYPVNQLIVSEASQPDANGKLVTQKVVRFKVGAHGPFTLRYTPPDGSTEQITADINSQIQQLRALDQIGQY